MITSENTVLYAYVLFLIGCYDYGIDSHAVRDIIVRWFFVSSLTGRYTSSPESQMEADLGRLRGIRTADDFMSTLDGIITETLTEDFRNIILPSELATSSARTLLRYLATQLSVFCTLESCFSA